MEPVGEVAFESVPEGWATYTPCYAEMGIALGQADGLQSIGYKPRFYTDKYMQFGVDIDKSSLNQLYEGGLGKEQFYEIGADVHLIDPNWLINNFEGWDQDEVDTIAEWNGRGGGNTIFRQTDDWHSYRYYSMYEAFEKVARIHREMDRFTQLRELHDEYIAGIQADLPAADDRPNALLTFAAGDEPEAFYPYRVSDQGTNKKQFHDLGITDALADTGIEGLSENDRGQIDYETMLEVDPDSILVRGHEDKSRREFEDTVVSFMRDHETASALTAVENGMVFRGGPIYSGPLHHLFLLERYATAYFPQAFSGELFDRGRVADIINGTD